MEIERTPDDAIATSVASTVKRWRFKPATLPVVAHPVWSRFFRYFRCGDDGKGAIAIPGLMESEPCLVRLAPGMCCSVPRFAD